MHFTLQNVALAQASLIDLHSTASSLFAHHTWGLWLVCGCHRPSPCHAIDDSYSLMKLYSSFLSRAALTRWTLTIHPLSGTHLFPLLFRVLTSHLLPERLVSAISAWRRYTTPVRKWEKSPEYCLTFTLAAIFTHHVWYLVILLCFGLLVSGCGHLTLLANMMSQRKDGQWVDN